MTDRLYYNDPYLQEFDATLERVERRGERLVVTLDRTAFYPSSGGQPFDTGVFAVSDRRFPIADACLGSFRVIDVVDQDDGSIGHVVEPGTTNVELRTPNVEPGTPNPAPRTPNPVPWTPNLDPQTPNLEPQTNLEPGTLNLEPGQGV